MIQSTIYKLSKLISVITTSLISSEISIYYIILNHNYLVSAESIKEMMIGTYHFYLALNDFCKTLMEKVFQDKLFMDFLEYDTTKYDVLFLESHFCQEPLIAISHKQNIPAITFQAMSLTPWYSFLSGNEVSLHLQPNLRSPYTNRMNFLQRLRNFFINVFELCMHYYDYIPHQVWKYL